LSKDRKLFECVHNVKNGSPGGLGSVGADRGVPFMTQICWNYCWARVCIITCNCVHGGRSTEPMQKSHSVERLLQFHDVSKGIIVDAAVLIY